MMGCSQRNPRPGHTQAWRLAWPPLTGGRFLWGVQGGTGDPRRGASGGLSEPSVHSSSSRACNPRGAGWVRGSHIKVPAPRQVPGAPRRCRGPQSGFLANRILQLEDPRKAALPSRVCWSRTQTRSRTPWGRGLRPGHGRSLVSSPRCSQPLPLPRAPGLKPPGLWTRIRGGASPGWSPLPSRS